ncbi:MAG: hypothetical protein AB8B63_15190 [Granulosicoccus sp.]
MTTLTFTRKTLSLRDNSYIRDENGTLLFEASRIGVFKRDFAITNGGNTLCASLSPESWKPEPSWQVSDTKESAYTIKRRKKSFQRFYWIEGGLHDGVLFEGGGYDTRFRIRKDEHVIAEALEERFSTKAAVHMQLLEDSDATRLLCAIALVVISKEKQEQRTGHGS